jgi:hypothetical protein
MKKWILIIVGLLTLVGAVIGISAIVDKKDDGLKEIHPTFTRGTLNQTGQWVDGKENIYTEEMFECQGLTIKLDFEHNIKYEVFYYDKNGSFIEKTGPLTEDYVNDDLTRIFARIVITPDWSLIDTNTHEIKWYEVNKYSKQLTIEVNEVQRSNVFKQVLATSTGGITIFYEDGMTWEQWVYSDFNDIGMDSDLKCNGKSLTDHDELVNLSDLILVDGMYDLV